MLSPKSSTLCEYIPLHDPNGWVGLVVAMRHTTGKHQSPMRPGWTPPQGLFTLSEQLVRVALDHILFWALLLVRLSLVQGRALQGLGKRTKQPAAAGTHWTN